MTIHTDTFPLVCQQAANSPILQLRCRVIENTMHVYLENRHVFAEHSFESMPVQVDITPLLTKGSIEALAKKDQPVSINLVDNKTFKHLLERLDKKDPVIL